MGCKRAKKTLGACQTRGRMDTHHKRGMKRAVAAARARKRGSKARQAAGGAGASASASPESNRRVRVVLDMSDPTCASLGTKKHSAKLLNSLDTLLVLAAGTRALERVGAPGGPGVRARGDSESGGGVEESKAFDTRDAASAAPGPDFKSDSESDSESARVRAVLLRGLDAARHAFAEEIVDRACWAARVATHQLSSAASDSESESAAAHLGPTIVYGFDGYAGAAAPRAAAEGRAAKAAAKLEDGLTSLQANNFKEGECQWGWGPSLLLVGV